MGESHKIDVKVIKKDQLIGNIQILKQVAQTLDGVWLEDIIATMNYSKAEIEYMLEYEAGKEWRKRGIPFLNKIWNAYISVRGKE